MRVVNRVQLIVYLSKLGINHTRSWDDPPKNFKWTSMGRENQLSRLSKSQWGGASCEVVAILIGRYAKPTLVLRSRYCYHNFRTQKIT